MTQEQITFLISIGIDPGGDLGDIEESVADYFQLHGISNDKPNEVGVLCLGIIDSIQNCE